MDALEVIAKKLDDMNDTMKAGSELPVVGVADAGKILIVGEDGKWAAGYAAVSDWQSED